MKRKTLKLEPIDLKNFGDYRMGLTDDETRIYILNRAKIKGRKWKSMPPSKIMGIFYKTAGCNTSAIGPQGQCLMYRWDIERFADQMFNGTPTFFD